MFCKNCENFMDITNNIGTNADVSDTEMKRGVTIGDGDGDDDKKPVGNEDDDDDNKHTEHMDDTTDSSSDYDVSIGTSDVLPTIQRGKNTDEPKKSKSKQSDSPESIISDETIISVLNGSNTELNLKNFNVSDLNKNPTFNKLSTQQKTLIINRILDKISKGKSFKQSTSSIKKESYFYCKSCGYYEKIPPRQFIFSRGDEKKDDMYNQSFINYKHDNTLPYSRNYNCINDKCITHKKPELKMAVFYRQKESYNVRYICTLCDSYWNTFVEKTA